MRPWLAEAQGFQAELCARRGDAAAPLHYAARAADGYARCGMHVHAELARQLGEDGVERYTKTRMDRSIAGCRMKRRLLSVAEEDA